MTNGSIYGLPEQLSFSVDTHLLRELGTLLVGRNSTALVELLKNAYDADATSVTVHGEGLSEMGLIRVSDNGHGMTFLDFQDKFLRIAGRSKEGDKRRSPVFGRRFTGAKGIGRLSAHKLASILAIESRPDLTVNGRAVSDDGVQAVINWEAIEASKASMDDAREIAAERQRPSIGSAPGTTLELQHLHSEWNSRQLNEFLAEVRSTRPDSTILARPLAEIFGNSSLLGELKPSDTGPADPGFTIELSGDLAGSESQWPTLLSHVNWMIEIDATEDEVVNYRITPSTRTRNVYPTAEVRNFAVATSGTRPLFEARILVRDGSDSTDSRLPDLLNRFSKEASGVRLYVEGFRVLPYGSPRNDWLGLDQATVGRDSLTVQESLLKREDRSVVDERTYQLSNGSYFGGVFLHEETSGGLQMVVNREGYLPGDSLDAMILAVKRGIDLSVRIRAALGAKAKTDDNLRKVEARRREVNRLLDDEVVPDSTSTLDDRREAWLSAGRSAASELRSSLREPDEETRRNIAIVNAALDQMQSQVDESLDERAQLRILASLGTQVGAFVHEVNGVLAQARVIRALIDQLIESTPDRVAELRAIRQGQNELIATLERQALYLSDSMGAEARRRRVRQPVADRLQTAIRLLGGAASQREVVIEDALPPGLKSPPMFPAELNVVLTNLVSNAIKAASSQEPKSPNPIVRVSGRALDGELELLVENTGVEVRPEVGEKWFAPFETSTNTVDPVLGQGLGLGLPLTRRIIEEYGGDVRFVRPSEGMSTAVRVIVPDR